MNALHADPGNGLSDKEAESRLEEFRPNQVEESKRVGSWKLLVEQFKSVVILILVAAGVLAGVMGKFPELIAVFLVVVVNTALVHCKP